MKRIRTKGISLALATFLVSGCGPGNGDGSGDGDPPPDYDAEARESITEENMDDILDRLDEEISADETDSGDVD